MHKSELLSFLDRIGASPLKRLSQNFLIDENIVRKLVSLANIQPGDQVLEIGSGPGAITEELLAAGAKVVAVEMDRLFSIHLKPHPNLMVHSADILTFPLDSLASGSWKVVSNLPFHITAPVLEKLFTHSSRFLSYTLIVQKEVVDRMRALPRSKSYGSLSLFVQFYAQIEDTFPISASCFYPQPSVDSTAIQLIPHQTTTKTTTERFFSILRKAFQQRRKMLSSSLREIHPQIAQCLASLNINPKARPEELCLTEWIAFIETIDRTSPS